MRNEYLRTNHWTDAVASLEAAQEFCARITLDEHQWKWALIATHSTVQGFMALTLEQGNGLLVLRDDIAAKWLNAHELGKPYPEEKMDFFLSLYEKVKSDVVCRFYGSKKFIAESSHDSSMQKLNELRNDYIHFRPKGWSIELAGLPFIALKCLEVAKFLAFDSFTIIWHDGDLRYRAERAFAIVQAELMALDVLYKVEIDKES
jgi:hypothetical protein